MPPLTPSPTWKLNAQPDWKPAGPSPRAVLGLPSPHAARAGAAGAGSLPTPRVTKALGGADFVRELDAFCKPKHGKDGPRFEGKLRIWKSGEVVIFCRCDACTAKHGEHQPRQPSGRADGLSVEAAGPARTPGKIRFSCQTNCCKLDEDALIETTRFATSLVQPEGGYFPTVCCHLRLTPVGCAPQGLTGWACPRWSSRCTPAAARPRSGGTASGWRTRSRTAHRTSPP